MILIFFSTKINNSKVIATHSLGTVAIDRDVREKTIIGILFEELIKMFGFPVYARYCT